MLKHLVIVLGLALAGPLAYANGNSNNSHGHDCEDGQDGRDGVDGINGTNGRNGADGFNASTNTAVGLEAVVRLYDGKRLTLALFDSYDLRGGRNHFVGARVSLKLGTSYEERRIAELESQIALLMSVAHFPNKSQYLLFPHGGH